MDSRHLICNITVPAGSSCTLSGKPLARRIARSSALRWRATLATSQGTRSAPAVVARLVSRAVLVQLGRWHVHPAGETRRIALPARDLHGRGLREHAGTAARHAGA